MKNKKVEIRATAMRIANLVIENFANMQLSDDFAIGDWIGRHSFPVPQNLNDWPIIDVDPLLDREMFYMPDDGSTPVIWPFAWGLILPYEDGYRIAFAKSVSPKEVRGKVKYVQKYMALYYYLSFDNHNRMSDRNGCCAIRCGRQWRYSPSASSNFACNTFDESARVFVDHIIGHALRSRYEWSAVFHFPSGLRLRFGCSAYGALQLFNDRMRDDLDSRRKALLHWVRRHWRNFEPSKKSSEVRQHLRGVTRIEWQGMTVDIYPSAYELDQVASTANDDKKQYYDILSARQS